jgi:hypothetical protein
VTSGPHSRSAAPSFQQGNDHDDGFLDIYHVSSWEDDSTIATAHLQRFAEISKEKNSATISPIPIDTIALFLKGLDVAIGPVAV